MLRGQRGWKPRLHGRDEKPGASWFGSDAAGSRGSMGGAEHPAALQGVPSHRDATRKGEEQFAQKPHSIRHSRMLPII